MLHRFQWIFFCKHIWVRLGSLACFFKNFNAAESVHSLVLTLNLLDQKLVAVFNPSSLPAIDLWLHFRLKRLVDRPIRWKNRFLALLHINCGGLLAFLVALPQDGNLRVVEGLFA